MSETRAPDPSEAGRLLAEPIIVEHPAGREVELVFTMRALVEVERQFGSFRDFEDALNAVLRDRLRAPVLTFVVKAFDALLYDDPAAVRDHRADCLELAQLGGHVQAVLAAWERAWPAAEDAPAAQPEGADPNPESGAGAASPGTAGTTSASSALASDRTASGG